LCDKNKIEDATWYQSSKNENKIIVLGRGIQEVKGNLEEEAKKIQGFLFQFVESGPLHTNQCTANWKIEKEEKGEYQLATCNLLLAGDNGEEEQPYVLTVAHVSLTRAECRWLLCPGNAMFLDSARDDLSKRASAQQYHLIQCLSNNNGPSYALQHPALLCYRHYYYESKTTEDKSLLCWRGSCSLRDKEELCHHSYMNDISVLLIEPCVFEKFVSDLKAQADQPLKFVKILECNKEHVEKMMEIKTKVFVGAYSTPYRIR